VVYPIAWTPPGPWTLETPAQQAASRVSRVSRQNALHTPPRCTAQGMCSSISVVENLGGLPGHTGHCSEGRGPRTAVLKLAEGHYDRGIEAHYQQATKLPPVYRQGFCLYSS
jgi:hypothetical protein